MFRDFKKLLAIGFLSLLTGCALFPKERLEIPEETPVVVAPAPAPPTPAPAPKAQPKPAPPAPSKPEPAPPKETPSPRTLASLELSSQARALLEENKPDEAIRILEQAMNLAPNNGETYYYLAEAWLLKGNPSQAAEYNALAEIRFQNDPEGSGRVADQKHRIDNARN